MVVSIVNEDEEDLIHDVYTKPKSFPTYSSVWTLVRPIFVFQLGKFHDLCLGLSLPSSSAL